MMEKFLQSKSLCKQGLQEKEFHFMAIDTLEKRRRSMNCVLHPAAVPIYPIPYDGNSKTDRAHVSGFFLQGATLAIDSSIVYAVQVEPGWDQRYYDGEVPSKIDIGLKDGIFRWITGRPGFDGTQTNVFWEEIDAEEHVRNTNQWFEGFLIDKGLSNPSRRIDIKESGDYATLNGFDFSVRNDKFFWDLIEQNKIYIANSTVKVFVVINRTFYCVWQGIVSSTSYTETEFRFDCESNFKAIHRQFPPEIVTESSFPGVNEKTVGEAIPVCLGDIPYAKGLNVSGPQEAVTLVKRGTDGYSICGATEYKNQILKLKTEGCNGSDIPENLLKGYYLRVIRGEGDDYYIITENKASSGTITEVHLDRLLDKWTPECALPPKSGVVNDKVWYFQVVKAPVNYVVSQRQIKKFWEDDIKNNGPILAFNYDKEYLPVGYAVIGHTNTAEMSFAGHSGFDTISEKSAARKSGVEKTADLQVDPKFESLTDKSQTPFYPDPNDKVEFNLTFGQTLNNNALFEWADEFHLALDMSCLFLSDTFRQKRTLTVTAFLLDSYGNKIEKDLLSNEGKSFRVELPSSKLYYGLNLIANEYYYNYYYNPDDNDTFWPLQEYDGRFTGEVFDTANKTLLNQTMINEIYNSSSSFKQTIRLVIRIEPQGSVSSEFNLAVNTKEITFYYIKGSRQSWLEPISVEELKESSVVPRSDLFDRVRQRRNEDSLPESGESFVELQYNVDLPYQSLKDATSCNLCSDIDIRCYDTKTMQSPLLTVKYAAYRIKNDTTVETIDLFKNSLVISPILVNPYTLLNFIPLSYHYLDSSREKTLWPVGTIGTGDSLQTIPAKDMTLLNKDRMALVTDNGLTRTIHVTIAIQKRGDDIVRLRLKEAAIIAVKETEFSEDEVYVRCSGENKIVESNSIYGAFYHILSNYDGIPEKMLSFGNLPSLRTTETWGLIGRQITEQKNSFDYLRELCRQSFVGIFPSRKGAVSLSAWLQLRNEHLPVFDDQTIIRDSIKNYSRTKPQDLYNDFLISYAYNPGPDSFDKVLFVTNAWENEFPSMYKLAGGTGYILEGGTDVIAEKDANSNEVRILFNITTQFVNYLSARGIFLSSLVSFEGLKKDARGNITVEPGISYYQGIVTKIDEKNSYIQVDTNGTFYIPTTDAVSSNSGILVSYNKHFSEIAAIKRVWTTFVGGLSFEITKEESAYQIAKTLWNRCRESYLYTGKLQHAPESISTLKWYVDEKNFKNTISQNGALCYLRNLIDWTTLPKAQVGFTIPINGNLKFLAVNREPGRNIQLELLDKVIFKDTIFTKGEERIGWITKIEPDLKKGEIKIELILEPDDYSDVIIERGIPENDDMPWIYESGDRDDQIIET
jgi:hypothetical protein